MKLPSSYYNMLSYTGAVIAGIAFILFVFILILSSIIDMGSYVGIIIFLVLPVFIVLGLILIPVGMRMQVKKAKRLNQTVEETRFILNLNIKQHRNAAMVFLAGSVVFLLFSAVGSYELYHYSESVEFCGTVCHEVMKPEYVAYQNSAHARVTCAQCHIGSGAEWFVKAKISGLYQVYSVLFNKVPRPIETPIANLRPARETCEQCHWPQKFYTNSLRSEKYYLTDEANTEWQIIMQMKTGSENSSQKQGGGIHWHINPNVQIDYIATDIKREEIGWVRYINKLTGDTTIFYDEMNPIADSAFASYEMRTMDCMDCHNRPAHNYLTPATFVNNAMANGSISPQLPEIKSLAMQIFVNEFGTADSALTYIEKTVWDFYMENYPDVIAENELLVKNAIKGLQLGFSQNMFPEMNANWDAYPDHIGHMEFNGCFRCHNNTHVAENGNTISNDCNLCHSILEQGSKSDTIYTAMYNAPLNFIHPVDIEEAWKETRCSDCHRYLY